MNCRSHFPAFNAFLPSTTAVCPTAVLKCGDSAKVLKSILSLNSFILSVTTFNDLLNVMGTTSKSDLEDRNVLFMDDGGPAYLGKLLTKALA